MDAAALAEESGLHITTVRFHLDALTRAGLVVAQREPTKRRGRPRLLYRASSRDADDANGYARLAKVLARHWSDDADAGTRAENAGRDWAAEQDLQPDPDDDLASTVGRLSAVFSELGFDAEPDGEAPGHRILLHHCPFAAVAAEHPEVACTVHLGLLRGALESLDAPATETSLVPFAAPGLCIARLRAADTAYTQGENV